MNIKMLISDQTMLYILSFLTSYGTVWGQFMYCPAEDWIIGSSITFRCYLPKDVYPSRCVTGFTDQVTFRKDPYIASDTNLCRLSNVSNTCPPSSSGCSCESGNSTHYSLQYTFTVHSDDSGTWVCSVFCRDGITNQLPNAKENCDNRVVQEPTTTTTPATSTTPPVTTTANTTEPTCDFCQCRGCDDKGGCGGCIALFVSLGVIVVICIIVFSLHMAGIIRCPCCQKTNSVPVSNQVESTIRLANTGTPNSANKNPDGRR